MTTPAYLLAMMNRGRGPVMMPPTPRPMAMSDPRGAALANEMGGMERLMARLGGGGERGIGNTRAGMLQAGLSLLGADYAPGQFGTNLANAIQMGLGTTQALRHQQQFDRDFDALNLAPETKAMLRLFGPEGARLVMEQPEETTVLGPNEAAYRGGTEVARNVVPESADEPTHVEEFRFYQTLTPEQQREWERLYGRQPGTTINVDTQRENDLGDIGGLIKEGARQADGFADQIAGLDMAIEVASDPALARVTGPFSEVKTFAARVRGDDEALALAQAHRTLTGEAMLDKLERFTGPKTEKEQEISDVLVGGLRDLTPPEMVVAFNLTKRALMAENRQWARRVLRNLEYLTPAEQQEYGILARQILEEPEPGGPTSWRDLGIR